MFGVQVKQNTLRSQHRSFHQHLGGVCGERERDLFFKVFKLKLDLPFFRDLFLSILHQNEARVGGIFFHHKSITSLNIASNTLMMDLVLCSTQLVS